MSGEDFELRSGSFNMSELVKVEPPKYPALLKSGGPIFDVLDIDDDGYAHCQWDRFIDGVKESVTEVFPIACLYKLVPFVLAQNDYDHPATEDSTPQQ